MNRQFGGMLAAVSLAMGMAGISESASAKKPPPPAPSTPSFYFVDSSNPPKVIGKALEVSVLFSFGNALVTVSGPSGAKSLTLGINRSNFSPSGSLLFESMDCSGTAYVRKSPNPSFPGLGTLDYTLLPGYDGITQTEALLYVGDTSMTNTISVGSIAYSMTLGTAGYVFDCFSSYPSSELVFPAVFYGNLHDTYLPPFDIVVP